MDGRDKFFIFMPLPFSEKFYCKGILINDVKSTQVKRDQFMLQDWNR